MPKISVVLPVYNGARFLTAAVDSVLAQTFSDWELVIVNDGSTDETADILAGYEDPRIQIHHQPNRGEAAARNIALECTAGAYVAFLDADDMYLPGAFAAMLAFLEKSPQYGVVFCDGYVIDEKGRRLMTLTQHRPGVFTGEVLDAIVLDAAVVTVPVCTLTRSQAIQQAAARFDATLTIGSDWDFWIQLARWSQFGYLDQLTCAYRVHRGNITTQVSWQKRRRDLITGRQKVLAAPWFGTLQPQTRYQFLYHLLVHLLAGSIHEQHALLSTEAVLSLDRWMQASLWRQVSMQALQRPEGMPYARSGLAAALRADPASRKTRVLLWLTRYQARPAYLAFRAWQVLHRLAGQIRRPFAKRSRPMPHALRAGSRTARKENG